MYNLWGFKLPPTVTASLWSSFLPWGRPSGSILILQWNCRPSLLLFLFSVLSSSIVAPLHLFLLSRFAAVLQGPRATERKTLWEGFYIIIFLLFLSFFEFVSLPFHDSHVLISPWGSHKANYPSSLPCQTSALHPAPVCTHSFDIVLH